MIRGYARHDNVFHNSDFLGFIESHVARNDTYSPEEAEALKDAARIFLMDCMERR